MLDRIDIGVAAAGVQINTAEDPGLGWTDGEASESINLVIAEAAGVNPGGDTRPGGNGIGLNADTASSTKTVSVKIDESWGNVKPARIDDVQASLRRNVVFDSGDRSVENSQVSSLAKTTARISHFTISDQEVIPFCFLRVASAPYEDCGISGQHLAT